MRIIRVFTALTVAAAAGGQTTAPPRRAHHELVYDEGSKRILLTAGSTPLDGGSRFAFFNDLWSFDGTKWTALPASGAQLSGIKIAYDSKQHRLVSFGGFDGASRGLLRVLGNNTWQNIGEYPDMAAAEPGFVYDAKRDRFVEFGGSAAQGRAHGDTWILEGTKWSKLATENPPARQGHAMVYDARRDRVVLFGGMGASAGPGQPPPPLGDTWEFDGTKWKQVSTTGPSPRFGFGATYDSKRGRMVIFGGLGAAGFNGDTWAWDGNAWKKLSDGGPEARGMGYMAYDKQRDRVVMFGGRKGWPNGDLDDTWELDGAAWKKVP